jgi:hypothetical protein
LLILLIVFAQGIDSKKKSPEALASGLSFYL